jgi:nucleoside-diphosphate-sugar epimerase
MGVCIIVPVVTLFLTGGSGFVGSHAARIFLGHGWRVRALVRWPERVGLLPAGVEVVRGDLTDASVYRDRLKDCQAVLHCAGATSAPSLADFRRVNVEGTEALVRAAATACPDAVFVHVSSQAASGPSRDGRPVMETDRPEPVSWYGRSKLEGELAVARHFPGPWSVVRPSVVYGAGDPGLLQMFTVVARGVAPIPAGGRGRVQLLAVEDLARVLFAAAQRPDLRGRSGFAAGDTVSMGDLVREIAALRTPRARTVSVPGRAIRFLGVVESIRAMVTATSRPFSRDKVRDMLQGDWLCDAEPFLRDLRVEARIRWREGIRRTCRWYVDARWLAPRAFARV